MIFIVMNVFYFDYIRIDEIIRDQERLNINCENKLN